MDKLTQNLLDNDLLIQSIDKFVFIQGHIASLDKNDPNYKKLVEYTDTLLRVLTAFSEPYGNKP